MIFSLLNNNKLDESIINNTAQKLLIKFSYFTDCEKKKKFLRKRDVAYFVCQKVTDIKEFINAQNI